MLPDAPLTAADDLVRYFDRIRQRTMRVVAVVPAERIEWTYGKGKFTFGDILRHLASIERWMYAENAALRPSCYPGHGRELADGYDAVVGYMKKMHEESMKLFAAADLNATCTTPGGASLPVGKWLRAMIEHECHHRGQLYLYCSMIEVPTPPIFGLTEEQVLEKSAGR